MRIKESQHHLNDITNEGLTLLYKFKMTHQEVDVTYLMNFIMLLLSPDGIGFLLMQTLLYFMFFSFIQLTTMSSVTAVFAACDMPVPCCRLT
jgi:hypothetical protein